MSIKMDDEVLATTEWPHAEYALGRVIGFRKYSYGGTKLRSEHVEIDFYDNTQLVPINCVRKISDLTELEKLIYLSIK
jgi:hypothetical protein